MFNSNTYNNNYSYNNPNAAFPQTLGNPNSFNNNFKLNHSLIEQQQNTNLHNTMHDNLHNNIKNESIKEFQITVDSIDRNINLYPDPFTFKLTMSNASFNVINDGKEEKYFYSPNINRNFRNVKYIKIDSIVMPKYYDTTTSSNTTTDYDITKERFILLRFNNINNTSQLGTNDISNSPSILFYPKHEYGNFVLFKPVNNNSNIIYVNDNNLINLNNIEFEFFKGDYKKLEFKNKTQQTSLNVDKQVVINLRVGIIENSVNTEINYR